MLITETIEIREIVDKISNLTNPEEVLAIARMANNYYKQISRQEKNSTIWIAGMKVQMKLSYQDKKPFDVIGVVKKVNKVTLRVEFNNTGLSTIWAIPKSMLQIV